VQSRWAKHESPEQIHDAGLDVVATDTSDRALLALLKRLRAASDPAEAGQLADRIERVIFHRQFGNA
jgi:hypothetical protein